jgi:hypothetical protein
MTASNSLGEQFKLYHASDQEFNVGDMIKPGSMVPPSVHSRESKVSYKVHSTRWSDDFAERGHDQFVWMSHSPESTEQYGRNLYEVQPEGLTAPYKTAPSRKFPSGRVISPYHVSLAPAKVVRRGKLAGPHPNNPDISKIEWDE